MKKPDKKTFLESSVKALSDIYDEIFSAEIIKSSELNSFDTVMVMVDIINGFIYEGALCDRSIEEIIEPAAELLEKCCEKGIDVLAFADCHCESSEEFSAFPEHCVEGSSESEIVDRIASIGGYRLIRKNSVNGFHAKGFQQYLSEHPEKTRIIVCGDCTDICVLNFCLSVKTWLNENNIKNEVIVMVGISDTYGASGHDKELMNAAAFKIMKTCGIKLAGGIVYDG